jgi:TonB family protein
MNIRNLSAFSLAAALAVSAVSPLSAAIQGATPLSQVAPTYAHDLRLSGVEGEVVVGFTISKTGEVQNAAVVSSTDRALEDPTLAAVRQWRFSPAMKDGVAVSVKAVQAVSYSITGLRAAPDRVVTMKSHPASEGRS